MKYKVEIRDADYGTVKGTLDDRATNPEDIFFTVANLAHYIGANLTLEIEMPSWDDLPEATE